jgi:uncharacterized lipoprotein YmbA
VTATPILKRFAYLMVAAIWVACATSPAQRYYTLDSIPPSVHADGRAGRPVWIARVIVPKTLDRLQLVRRASANRLDVSENDLWAAPLDDMVRRVLSQDLAARMPEGTVIQPGEPLPAGRLRPITLSLSEFDSDLDGRIVLNAQWTVESAVGSDGQFRRDEHIVINAGSGAPDAVSAGMSRALAILADRIADELADPSPHPSDSAFSPDGAVPEVGGRQ